MADSLPGDPGSGDAAAGDAGARPLIAVLDYGIGNLRSAQKALEHVGADARLTADPGLIADAAGVVLPGVGAFGRCVEALGEAGLAVALQIASLVAYTVLTKVTLPPEPHLSMFTIFRIQLATKSITNVVPGGSAAGGTLGYRLFTEAGVPPTAAGFAMATVGLGSAVVLNLLLWVALLISIPLNGYNPLYAGAALVGVLLLASAGALVYLLMEGRDRAERVLRGITRRLPYVQEETASRFVHQLADRLHDLARQPQLIKRGVLWASINWLLEAASLWVFLRAFGSSMNPVNLVVAFGLAGVMAAIPITPGGLGVVEAVLTPTLVGFGVPARTATIGVLAWRFVQFWLPIPLGGVAYLSLRFGALGRQHRLGTVRDLAHETGKAATRRVWDDQTGEYRWVVGSATPVDRSQPPDEPI